MERFSNYIETDIGKCEKLWQEFSPKQSLFDLWDFCLFLCLAYQDEPYFIVLQENNKNVGLLPLCYIKERKQYLWFGGWWQEGISFWVRNPIHIPTLLSLCPQQTFLKGILIDDAVVEKIKSFISGQEKNDFGVDEPKYVLDISEIKSFEDYLAGFKTKRRKAIKRDLLLIERQNPEVIFNNFNDFKYLVAFSKERFKDEIKESDPWYDSAWKNDAQARALLDIIKHSGKNYQARMITAKIKQKTAGVDLVIIFNNCYYVLAVGYNIKEFSGIGNYFNMLNIKDALNSGLNKIDVLQGDYGWKHRWYNKSPLYYFSKSA